MKHISQLPIWIVLSDLLISLPKHVHNVCKSCFVQLNVFKHFRSSIFVNSKYVHHTAAKIISNTSGCTSITPVLKQLHWLPVEHRSVFKTAIMFYKFLHTGFSKYLVPYISSYSGSYSTRHSQGGGNFLVIPKLKPSIHKSVKQFGCSFFDVPNIWNALHDEIHVFPSPASFRKRLKPT